MIVVVVAGFVEVFFVVVDVGLVVVASVVVNGLQIAGLSTTE